MDKELIEYERVLLKANPLSRIQYYMPLSNISNIKQSLQKKNVSTSLSEPDNWLSSGNLSLNYIMTGNFFKGVPNKRSIMLAGESGSGKSFLATNIARNAQEAGYTVIYIDSENAMDTDFLSKIGMNLDEDWFLPVRASSLEELSIIMSEIFQTSDENTKLCVVVDSLTNLETEQELEAFNKSGELKSDMGLKAKKIKQVLTNLNNKVGDRDMFLIFNVHCYLNQNPLDGKGTHVVSGGQAQVYIPSITVMLKKLKLKEESVVTGIRMKAEVIKSRYNQLGLTTTIEIPYDKGMNPYNGVADFLESSGLVEKRAAWFVYKDENGEEVKFQKKSLPDHFDAITQSLQTKEPQEEEV